MYVEMFPELGSFENVVDDEKQPKAPGYVKASPSMLEYVDNLPAEVPSPEEVVGSIHGYIGHRLDNFFVGDMRRVRAYRPSGLADLQRTPMVAVNNLEDWKRSHAFYRRGRSNKEPAFGGTHYSADDIAYLFLYSEDTQLFEADVSQAHVNRINRFFRNGNRNGDCVPLLLETNPTMEIQEEKLTVFNADFGKINGRDFKLQLGLRYDYLLMDENKLVIVDTKFGSSNPYSRLQALLYILFAKKAFNSRDTAKPQNVHASELDIEGVEFYYRNLDRDRKEFFIVPASIRDSEFGDALDEFYSVGRKWIDQRARIKRIVKKRKESFVMPYVPKGKDFLWPVQPRLGSL